MGVRDLTPRKLFQWEVKKMEIGSRRLRANSKLWTWLGERFLEWERFDLWMDKNKKPSF